LSSGVLRHATPDAAHTQKSSRWLSPAATCAVCAIFFMLGVIFTRSESATSAGFRMPPQIHASREFSGSVPGIPAPGVATHRMRSGRTPSAPAQIAAKFHKNTPRQPDIRDVFLRIESHQIDENKENTLRAKANLRPSELSFVRLWTNPPAGAIHGQLSVRNGYTPQADYYGLPTIFRAMTTENRLLTIKDAPLTTENRPKTADDEPRNTPL